MARNKGWEKAGKEKQNLSMLVKNVSLNSPIANGLAVFYTVKYSGA